MSPKRRSKARSRAKSRGRLLLWLVVAGLAAGVGFVGGYLYRELPPPERVAEDTGKARAALEELLGPLQGDVVRFRVASAEEARELAARLSRLAQQMGEQVELGLWAQTAQSLLNQLTLDGQTSKIRLEWLTEPEPESYQLAVVIDDMGRSRETDQAFLDLPIEVTPSILPYLEHSEALARLAGQRGREYLLHLPMQPQGYPRYDPGAGAILEGMSEAEVRRQVVADLQAVPGAVGVNNHMGSRLTELRQPMSWVLDELKRANLFFLDSATSGGSVGTEVAQEMGLPRLRRDVFLDNEKEREAIGRQLEKAIQIARERGYAVAIGHPHQATLETLRGWAPRLRAAGVQVVPVSRIVLQPEGV